MGGACISNIIRCSGLNPRPALLKCESEKAKSPALTTSRDESAIWKETRPLPSRPLRRRVAAVAESLSAVLTLVRVDCHAGMIPKRMPVNNETAAVKAKMRMSKWVFIGTGSHEVESRCGMTLRPKYPKAKPATPPSAESSRLSVSTWRSTRPRVAPRARRTDISRWRAVERASRRLARFAHASRRTKPVSAPST